MALKYFQDQKFRKKDNKPYGYKGIDAYQNSQARADYSMRPDDEEDDFELAELRKARNDASMQRLINSREYQDKQRQMRESAIELAKGRTNAGNDRTTAIRIPEAKKDYSGLGYLPTYRGMNEAANGADVEQDRFKTEAATQRGWKGLIGTRSQEQAISREESLAHANEVYAPFKNNAEVTELFNQYVSNNDNLENLRMHGASADQKYHYVREKQKLEKQIRNITGMSKDNFNQVAENYTYLRHDEERQTQQERLDDASGLKKAALTGLNVATAAIGNYQSALGLLKKPNDPELGRDYNSVTSYWSNLNRDTKEAVHEDIDESTMADYQKAIAGFGYDAFTMGAESAASQMLGGAGLASFFAGGYTSSLEEAEQRGLTRGQAQGYALVSGGLEYLTERLPWNNLKAIYSGKAIGKEAVKGSLMPYVKALFKQAGEEAGEEVINGVGDIIADALINGDKSKINNAIQYYMQEEGLSEEEATRRAFFDEGKNILYAAATAAVSAGASAGPALAMQAYGVTNAGKEIVKNADRISDKESDYYIPDTRESYVADQDYEQAQQTRQAILAASEKAAKNERISGREARALAESYATTAENIDTARRARAVEQIERRQEAAKEVALKSIENTTSIEELETIKERNARDEAVVAAVEEKEAQMIEQGATTKEEIENVITPRKAFETAKEGNVIEEEKLESLPVETKLAYQYGKEAANDIKGSDLSDVDISSIENKNAKPGKRVQKIKDVKVNQRNELVFTTEDGTEINAYEANYTDKGKQVYKGENGILSLNKPSLVKIAMEAVEQGNYTGAISNLTTAIRTMDTLGRTQGINFEDALKSYGYMQNAVGRDILEQAFNANKEESKVFDEAKKVGRVRKSNRGIIREQTAENKAEYTSQFGNKDIEALLKQEHIAYSADNTEEAIRSFEDLSDAQKDFLDSFSSRTGVDFDFIYAKEGGIRGTYAPSTGKIVLNLAYSGNMFEVALHEGIGEFLQAHNAKAYNAISESILNYYASTQADKLAEKIRNYQRTYQNLKYRESANELVNDALGQIFSTDEGLKELTRWLDENETEAQSKRVKKTFLDYFNDLKNMIKDIKSKGGLKEGDAKALTMAEKDAAKFAKQLTAAMNEAIAVRDAQAEITGVAEEGNSQRLSIEMDQRGKYFVNIQEDIISNLTSNKEIKDYVNEYIKEYYPSIDLWGFDIPVIRKSRNEFLESKYTKKIRSKLHDLFLDKMRIAANLDEIVNAADHYKWEAPKHTRTDNIIGFIRGKVQVRVGQNDYIADVLLANDSNVGLIFYDIIDLTPTTIKAAGMSPMVSKANTVKNPTASNDNLPSVKNIATPKRQKSAVSQNKGGGKSLDVEQKAIEHFGTTKDFKFAGYMLPDGQLLDFSGAHWLDGASEAEKEQFRQDNGMRQVDHDDIYEVMEASGDNRKQFMDRGNIRLNPEAPGFNISSKIEPTAAQYRELKEFIREVKKNPYYDASNFYVDIEDTHPNKISYANNLNEDRIINDIKKYYETGEMPQQSSLNDFRYSFAGFKAETADLYAVTEADKMRSEGKSMEEIFAKTGWYLGNDDKWRYEISNKDARLYLDGDALLADTEEHKHYRELVDYINSSKDMGEEWMKAFDEVGKYIDKHKIGSNKKEYRLEEILKHDELFEAYPSLRRIKISIEDLPAGTNGRFNPKTNTIELSETLKRVGQNPLKRTLFHELQHAIQQLEGFAHGSSPEFWNLRGLPRYTKEEDIKAYEDAKKKVDDLRETLPEDFLKKYDKYTSLMHEYAGESTNLDLYESAQRLYKLLQDEDKAALDELDDAYWELDFAFPTPSEMLASEAYYATAGEIEAREVADRIDMTEEERRANLPKMTDESGRVVFAENATTPWRYPTGDDFRFSKKVDSDGSALSIAQEEFFKDSKAVDKSGNLLVLYHGSQSAEQFNEFKLDTEVVNGRVFGDGFYFTPFEDVAKFWGDQNVYKVYLNLTKPFYATETAKVPKDVREYLDRRIDEIRTQNNLSKPEGRVQQAIDKVYRHYVEARNGYSALGLMHAYGIKNELKLLGYDGVIVDDKKVEKEAKQYVAFYPEQIKRTDNYNPTVESADIRKSIEVKFDEDTIDIPARDYDDMIFFTGSDEEIEAAEKQDINVMSYFANIIQSKGFNGLMFSWESDWGKLGKHIEQRYVTKSTREGEDWHLSKGRDGEPLGHTWYANKNDKIELYNHNNHDLSSLYSDLLQNTPKEGVKVYVLRDATESNARYSKAVFGEESQYSSQIEQTQFVSQILSTLNNQLKGTSVSMPYINDTVKYILDKYQADLNPDEFTMELAQFIAYMTANEQVDYNQMMNYLLNIGDEVIQASNLKDPEEVRIYSELKKELSSHKINLTDLERKELISKFGGSWNAVFGKLNEVGIKLNKAGQHMDGSTYSEIVDKFREIAGVQLDEEKGAVDQIATIIDAMDALKPSAYKWEGATDMDKALDVATTIIDRYYSMATSIKESNIVKGTEKGAAAVERAKQQEIKKLRAKQQEYKAKVNEEFQQLVEDRKKVIEEQQAFYKRQAEIERQFRGEKRAYEKKVNMSSKELEKTARLQAQMQYKGIKETEAKRKNKENIVRICMRLINWMNKPTDTRHVPTFLKPALTDLIKSINFMPASMRKGDDGTISAIKWQESMRKLQQVIKNINSADVEATSDADKVQLALTMDGEDIADKMQQLLDKYGGTADISRMKAEDLKILSDIMTSISKGISQMNENFMNRRYKHVGELAEASMDQMMQLKAISDTTTVFKDKAADFLNLDMLEPISFFEELGEASASIMQEFFDGEKIGIEIIREAEDFFDDLAKELNISKADIRSWSNDTKNYNIDGGTIALSSADIMSLYCSYKREMLDQQERPYEATHHIAAGGIKGYKNTYKKGKGLKKYVTNRNARALHANEGKILELINSLDVKQQAYADKVVDYMSTRLAAHGNETSNKMNGYSKFLGKYYFPLKTENNAIATTESNSQTGLAGMLALVHQSFTKSQLDKADNALVVMDFFDVVTEHITGMANYCAYSMPLSDALRWYNYASTERNNTENENEYLRDTQSIKGHMDRVKGKNARTYFENFLRAVNLDPAKNGGSALVQNLARVLTGLGRAKAIALNGSVWVQQPTAITRAADVIEDKYLGEGWAKMSLNPKAACEYAQKTSYLCYWKNKGFSDYRVTVGMKEIITGHETKMQELRELAGAPAGILDDTTWAAMYYAAENKIKDTTNLKEGTEEFHAAVEELFSDIINHTQVIDSNLRTTQTMKGRSDFEYLANAFKKEPQKTYNMLHRSYWRVYQYDSPEAKRKWHRTLRVYMITNIVNALFRTVFLAIRDDEDDSFLKKYLKKLFPYESYEAIKKQLEKPMDEWSNKDLIPLLRAVWGGKGAIGDNMDILSSMPIIAEIDSWFQGFSPSTLSYTSILTEANKTVNSLSSATATPYNLLYAVASFSDYVTGLGISNLMRDLRGFWNQSTRVTGLPRIEKSSSNEAKASKTKQIDALEDAIDSAKVAKTKEEKLSAKNEIDAAVDSIYQEKYNLYISDKEKPKTEEEAAKEAKEQTARTITTNFKPIYKRLVADKKLDEATTLMNNLIYAYGKVGYKKTKADFDEWLAE